MSIKVSYKIPESLVVKSGLSTYKYFTTIRQFFFHYLWQLGACSFVIYATHIYLGYEVSRTAFISSTIIIAIVYSLYGRKKWEDNLRQTKSEYTLDAELNDSGVKCEFRSDVTFIEWSDYLWYQDEPDALKMMHSNGKISYIPKSDNTQDAIKFTKTKVREYSEPN